MEPLYEIPNELKRLRASIDNCDAALVHILAERFRCTDAVSFLKADHHMPASDFKREKEQIVRWRCLAEESGLNPDLAEAFLKLLIQYATRHHEEVAAQAVIRNS